MFKKTLTTFIALFISTVLSLTVSAYNISLYDGETLVFSTDADTLTTFPSITAPEGKYLLGFTDKDNSFLVY